MNLMVTGVELWTPDGNKWQTEIDIKLAELRFHNQQLEELLADSRMNLARMDRSIGELEHHLAFLKTKGIAASMMEFHKIKREITNIQRHKAAQDAQIPGFTQRMSDNDSLIKELMVERINVRTQIIPIKDRR